MDDDGTRAAAVVSRLIALYEPGEFPAENIGGVGDAAPADSDGPTDRLERWRDVYAGQAAFECLVRTILSQNTSDVASQPAHDALVARYGAGGPASVDGDLARSLARADHDALADAISSAGLYNQKSRTLRGVAERVVDEYGGADGFDAFVESADAGTVRSALLDLRGVGPKTADCVLLFAGDRGGVFPVDTHVHRLYRRLGVAAPDADHEAVRRVLERDVPADRCGFGHTASIQFGRDYCTARRPACLDGLDACPLSDCCDRVGVDIEHDSVVDPAETAD